MDHQAGGAAVEAVTDSRDPARVSRLTDYQAQSPAEALQEWEEARAQWDRAKRRLEAAREGFALHYPPGPGPELEGVDWVWERRVEFEIVSLHRVPSWMLEPALSSRAVTKWKITHPLVPIPGCVSRTRWRLRPRREKPQAAPPSSSSEPR